MDDIAVCAAVIEIDEGNHVIVSACDNQFFRLMGSTLDETSLFPIPFDELVSNSALQGFREELLACFSSNRSRDAERHYDVREGELWVRFSLKPIRHVNGTPSLDRILLTGCDMAAKSRLMEGPDASAPRYRALVDLAYDAIVTMDQQHHITLFNRAAENLFGYSSEEVLGQPIVTLLPERYRPGHPQKVQHFSDTYQPSLRQATPPRMDGSNSVYGRHRDGSEIPVEVAVSKITLNNKIEFMAIVRDVSDRAQLMELLKKKAGTDALTGLPNRRGFFEFVEKRLDQVSGLSIFILDIDFFKKINDRYGHDVGDEVLLVLAKVGASMMHEESLFARWGGEEFVAAFPGTDAAFAYKVAEQLRQCFERQEFEYVWRAKPVPFTVSIGLVTSKPGEIDVDALMKRADRALYQAKRSGRNSVKLG